MIVKFPVYLKNKKQFNSFMGYMRQVGVRWVTGRTAADFEDTIEQNISFPVYIFYNNSIYFPKYNLTYYREKDMLRREENLTAYLRSRAREVEL